MSILYMYDNKKQHADARDTYFLTGILPVLSTSKQSFVCAFCKKFVHEPFI